MATKKDDDDLHNPFGPAPDKPVRKPEPRGNDPFAPTHVDKDSEWDDEHDDQGSTRDA